jgi:hypothetical protein
LHPKVTDDRLDALLVGCQIDANIVSVRYSPTVQTESELRAKLAFSQGATDCHDGLRGGSAGDWIIEAI